MSGSGGGGGGGGGGGEGGTDCASLSFPTVLNSPNPQVLQSCRPGDVFTLRHPNPPSGPVEAVDATGTVAGTVTGGRLAALLACMAAGEQYVARVVSVSNGRCQVEVRHV